MGNIHLGTDHLHVKSVATALALLAGVYVPALAATSIIRPPLAIALSLVIGVTAFLALALIRWFVVRGISIFKFGFAPCSLNELAVSLGWGLPSAVIVAWAVSRFPQTAPFDVRSLSLWQQVLFFVVAAPLQEELIFRGLIQSVLQARLPSKQIAGVRISPAVVYTAGLFAIIHLGLGWPTAVGAAVLALVAGEVRRSSGSLIPAVVVHSLFNAAALLF